MEMEVFEILFSQDRRLESTCVSIKWLGWLLLCKPKVRRVSPNAIYVQRLTLSVSGAACSPSHLTSQ
jgi:hypothetical protein